MGKPSFEEKKNRWLGMVDQGDKDFQAIRKPLVAPLEPEPEPQKQDEKYVKPTGENNISIGNTHKASPETATNEDPESPEKFTFRAPVPSRKSLTKRGWIDKTNKYDPRTFRIATSIAMDVGITFAELQDLALQLICDPKMRSAEVKSIFKTIKKQFS